MITKKLNLSSAVFIFLVGCTTISNDIPDPTSPPPFIGYWQMQDASSVISIEPCSKKSKKYCGKVIAYNGKNTARYLRTSDLARWGNLICNSNVLTQIKPTDNADEYSGQLYDFRSGETIKVNLVVINADRIDVINAPENKLDRSIDMAISAATGDPLSIITDMLISKGTNIILEHTNEPLLTATGIWGRVSYDEPRCDTSVTATGTKQ